MIYAGVDTDGTNHNSNRWIVTGGGSGLVQETDGSLRACQLRNGQVVLGVENPMSYNRPETQDTFSAPFEFSGEIRINSRAPDGSVWILGENRAPTWQHGVCFSIFADEDNNVMDCAKPALNVWSSSGQIDHAYGQIKYKYLYRNRVKYAEVLTEGVWHSFKMQVLAPGHHKLFWNDVLMVEAIEEPVSPFWSRPLKCAMRLDFYDYSLRNLNPGDSMKLPIIPVSMPSDLAGKTNGQLPASLLSNVGPRGDLHHLAARAWRALRDAADKQGLPLTYTYGGTYRTYAEQEALFRSRYSPEGTGGGCKLWNGVQWCKKSAKLATAATPGSSNHGWALAVDSAFDTDPSDGLGPDDAAAIAAHPQWPWLLANAHRFGWSWELQSENWHLRYFAGDNVPQAVLDYEASLVPPPSTTEEVDMIVIEWKPGTPSYTGLISTGTQLGWLFDGNASAVFLGAGAKKTTVTNTQLTALIKSSQTTTDPPPTLSASDQTLWAQRRG